MQTEQFIFIQRVVSDWPESMSLDGTWTMPILFNLLDQGYIPGLFGLSHGALQLMAYEELKKGNSQYFRNPINKKLAITVCTCLYNWLCIS